MDMANGTDPDNLVPAERLDEVAALLAMAMLRVWLKRRKERAISREYSLGLDAESLPPVTAGKP
jgi:hypothetical protein